MIDVQTAQQLQEGIGNLLDLEETLNQIQRQNTLDVINKSSMINMMTAGIRFIVKNIRTLIELLSE